MGYSPNTNNNTNYAAISGMEFGSLTLTGYKMPTATVTFNLTTDRVGLTAHGYTVDTPIRFSSIVTATGVLANVIYFVKTVVDADNFTLSTTIGGATLDITASGTGTIGLTRPDKPYGGSVVITQGVNTSNPIKGYQSKTFTKTAANTQGEGYIYPFTINREDQTKVLQIVFSAELLSGTYSSGTATTDSDVIVYIRDVATKQLIEPVRFKLQLGTAGTIVQNQLSFQATTNTSYELIFHSATSIATAFSFQIDSVELGATKYTYGSPVTDWVSYTPTLLNSGATYTFSKAYYKQVGDSIQIRATLDFTSAGSGTSSILMSLPSGLTIDSTKIDNDGGVGFGYAGDASFYNITGYPSLYAKCSVVSGNSPNSVAFAIPGIARNIQGADILSGSSEADILVKDLPILGWSSSTQMSSNDDTRVSVVTATQNFGSGVISATTLKWTSNLTQTHGSYDSSTGIFTAAVSGFYQYKAVVPWTATADAQVVLSLQKNGSGSLTAAKSRSNATQSTGNVVMDYTAYLVAGDNLRILVSIDTGSPTYLNVTDSSQLSIIRISGPSTIAASETVAARYTTAVADSIDPNKSSTLNFQTKDYDTHGSVTVGVGAWVPASGGNATSNWKFTCPIAGKYFVCASYGYATAATTDNSYRDDGIRVNGTLKKQSVKSINREGTQESYSELTTVVNCRAGDVITFTIWQNNSIGARTIVPSSLTNVIEIIKVGN